MANSMSPPEPQLAQKGQDCTPSCSWELGSGSRGTRGKGGGGHSLEPSCGS